MLRKCVAPSLYPRSPSPAVFRAHCVLHRGFSGGCSVIERGSDEASSLIRQRINCHALLLKHVVILTLTEDLASTRRPRRTDRRTDGNAGVENAIRAKLQGWNMQEWKKTGVDSRGGKCRSKLYGAPTRVRAYILTES